MAKMQLSKRDRAVLLLGALAVLIMAGTLVLRKPLAVYRNSDEQVREARQRLKDAQTLRDIIDAEQASGATINRRLQDQPRQGITLLMSEAMQKLNLVGRVDFSQRQSGVARDAADRLDTINLQLKGVSVAELTDLLYFLYDRNPLLMVERIDNLRPTRNNVGLEGIIVISSLLPS